MTCNDGVCDGVVALGPAAGDVTGLGYCNTCEQGSHAAEFDEDADDDILDDLLYEDGA